MSDPNDPYRFEDVGGGVNPFGESIARLREELELIQKMNLAEPFKKLRDALSKIPDTFKNLEKSIPKSMKSFQGLKPLEPVAKQINKSSFKKNVKGLGVMFGKMGGAMGGGFIKVLSSFAKVLQPLTNLLKPFMIVLDLISTLISVMVGEALRPMFEALKPIFNAIMTLMPVFAELGRLLGTILTPIIEVLGEILLLIAPYFAEIAETLITALMPIIDAFVSILRQMAPLFELIMQAIGPLIELALKPITMIVEFLARNMEHLLPLFEALIGLLVPLMELALVPLMVVLDVIFALLEPFMPLLSKFADVIVLITPFISILAEVIGVILYNAIKGVVYFFAVLIDIFTLGAAGALKAADQFFGEYEAPAPTSTPTSTPISPVPNVQMQHGGVALSHGVYELAEGGRPEIVEPLDKWEKKQEVQTALLGLIHDELIRQSYYNQQIVKFKEWDQAFGG